MVYYNYGITVVIFLVLGDTDGQEESQSFSTNLVVIVVVSGIVAVAVCATIFLVVRSRNKRQQHGDLSIPT